MTGGLLSSAEMVEGSPLTYRQLDHWARRRWLVPSYGGGTGCPRRWTPGELAVARLMVRLVQAGLEPEVAAPVARKMAAGNRRVLLAGHGLVLELLDPGEEHEHGGVPVLSRGDLVGDGDHPGGEAPGREIQPDQP